MSDTLYGLEHAILDRIAKSAGEPTRSDMQVALDSLGILGTCDWYKDMLRVVFKSNEDLNLFRLSSGIKEGRRIIFVCNTTT